MFILNIVFILFVSLLNLYAVDDSDKDISSILLRASNATHSSQKESELLYSSLDFNIKNSDSLFKLSLREDIALNDKIFLLKKALEANNFMISDMRDVYSYYFNLILRQNEKMEKCREIIDLYKSLNEDLKKDKDLLYSRLEASDKINSFDDVFYKDLDKAFALYKDDILFYKWFLKNNKYFPSLFSIIKLQNESYFTSENIDKIFEFTNLDEVNSVALFTFLKTKSKNITPLQSIYLLKYEIITPDEAYSYFTKGSSNNMLYYKMFYDVLNDPDIKSDFLDYYKNIAGLFLVTDKNNSVVFKEGVLTSFSFGITDYLENVDPSTNYFSTVYFKNKAPVYYENNKLGYKITYSVYPYVSMIEVEYENIKDIYTFSVNTFKYNIFENFDDNFDYIGINKFLITDLPEIFIPTILKIKPQDVSALNIRNNLIQKEIYKGSEVVEVRNYVMRDLVSIYRKVNSSKKFNYIEIYENSELKIKKVLLNDNDSDYQVID